MTTYNLEDRTFKFAKNVRAFVKKLSKSIANFEDSKQLIKASGSVGANYIAKNSTQKMISEGLLVGWICFFIASIAPSSILALPQQWLYFGLILSFLNYTRITNKVERNSCTS